MNYLNHGSNKGEALGFSLETVRGLDRIMSTKKYSLLNFVVRCLLKHDPKRLGFVQSYYDLPKVIRYSVSEFEKMKKEYNNNVRTIREEVQFADKMVEELKGREDEAENWLCYRLFADHFKPFLEDADRRLEMVKDNFEKISAKASKCAELYGLKSKTNPEDILGLLNTFLESVKKHQEAYIRSEQAAKKKAELEHKLRSAKERSKNPVGDTAKTGLADTGMPSKAVNTKKICRDSIAKEQIDDKRVEPEVFNPILLTNDLNKGRQGYDIFQSTGVVRPTVYGATNVPLLRSQPSTNTGARPQARNRARVEVNNRYKKKDEKTEKIMEFSASKNGRTTKFQQETVNLSKLRLL